MVLAAVTVLFTAWSQTAYANVALTQVSTDTFMNASSQHRTELEPDTFTFGSTIVSAFQVGRVFGGGSSDIGFATSTNGGANWTSGFLSGLTLNLGNGAYSAASDPSVAFDAKHNVWLISSLGVNGPGGNNAVFTSRSSNGLAWSNPVLVATGALDKNWIVCDDTSSSPFFGNCYTQYDITNAGNAIRLRTSTDGGLTWGPALGNSSGATGLGGQPVVRPNGTVIVPHLSGSQIRSFRSIDGGTSWRATVVVANISHHTTAGGLRVNTALPSAEVDAAGTVYVAWPDCRFRSGCTGNDIVLSKSTSETTWAAPTQVPDSNQGTLDHFTPGIGVDRTSSGSTARVGLTYYYYPIANCSAATCTLQVGYVSSTNGGSSWSAATMLAGPMSLSWLPNTSQGRMFGDYISTSILAGGGRAYAALPIAIAPTGSPFDQAINVPVGGLAVTGGSLRSTAAEIAQPRAPVQTAASPTAN
jgi:hypothetical protein